MRWRSSALPQKISAADKGKYVCTCENVKRERTRRTSTLLISKFCGQNKRGNKKGGRERGRERKREKKKA
jgi:hypothetical protein